MTGKKNRDWRSGSATGIDKGSTHIPAHKKSGASQGSSGGNVPAHKAAAIVSYPGRKYVKGSTVIEPDKKSKRGKE